jgi:hypothetical protein
MQGSPRSEAVARMTEWMEWNDQSTTEGSFYSQGGFKTAMAGAHQTGAPNNC